MKSQHADKKYECWVCHMPFETADLFQQHLKSSQHVQVINLCPMCGKGHKTQEMLISHIKTHDVNELEEHLRVSDGEDNEDDEEEEVEIDEQMEDEDEEVEQDDDEDELDNE